MSLFPPGMAKNGVSSRFYGLDTRVPRVTIVMMARHLLPLVAAVLAAAACAKGRHLTMLEEEMVRFRAENERIRAEDLEAEYERQKARSERLSEDLLALVRERDRLYGEYDALRAELARLQRERKGATERRDALAKTLADARAELARLKAEVEAERAAVAAAEAERKELEARRAAAGGP